MALSREAKDYIATHAYRIAKIIAHKADYEVSRPVTSRCTQCSKSGQRGWVSEAVCSSFCRRLSET